MAANRKIYKYFADSFSDKFGEQLRIGVEGRDYALIKLQFDMLAASEYKLNKKYDRLRAEAHSLMLEMEQINEHLLRGLDEKNMALLAAGIERSNAIGYFAETLFAEANDFYSRYVSFDEL